MTSQAYPPRLASPLALGAAFLLALQAIPHLHAATYYWDSNDSTAGFGTAQGTWADPTTNNSTQGWSASSAGTDVMSGTTSTTTSDELNFGTASAGLAAGTVTVSGTVSANSLTFGSASGAITLSGGNITLGGTTPTITVNNAADTIASSISGTAGFTKDGAGTLDLSGGNNSWNGTTKVSGGTLTISGNFSTTGAIQAGFSTTASTLEITGNLTQTMAANPRNLVIAGGNNYNGTVSVSGDAVVNLTSMLIGEDGGGHGVFSQSGGTVNFSAAVWMAGQTSTLNVSGGTFDLGASNLLLGVAGAVAANSTVTVNGTGSISMGTLAMGSFGRNSSAMTVNLGDGTTGGNLSITNMTYGAGGSAGPTTINFNGGTLSVDGNISMISQASTVVQSGGAFINVESGKTFTIGNDLTDGGGGGGLTKNGTGTLVLEGTNTYTGTTTVNAGTLTIGNNMTIGVITGSGNLSLGSGYTLTTNSSSDSTYTGVISGAGSITKNGSGTLSIPMASTYTGTTTINGGTMRIENLLTNGGADVEGTPGSDFNINNGATLVMHTDVGGLNRILSNNDAFTFDSNGGGTLEWDSGNVLMQSSNYHRFETTGGLQNVMTTTNGAYLNGQAGGGLLEFTVADGSDDVDLLVSAQINNALISKDGTGTMSLTTSTTGSYNITIEAGTLDIGGSATLAAGTYSANLTNNGTFSYSSSADQTISGVISGTGGLTKNGSSTLTLSASNTYSGPTLVTAGTLVVDGSLAAGSTVTVDSGATLEGTGTINGAVTINGNLNPGASPGVLNFGDSLSLGATSTTTMELNGTARGTEYDGIDVTGALTYGGNLAITVGSEFLGSSENFSLFTFSSASGDLASVSLAGAYGTGSFTNTSGVWNLTDSGGNLWSFSQASGALDFTAVPEPSTWALLAFGLAAGAMAIRRRKG